MLHGPHTLAILAAGLLAGAAAAQRHLFTFDGAAGGRHCGWAVAVLGDLDGDGRAEVAVSSPLAGNGEVRVFAGRDGRLLFTWKGDGLRSHFGQAVSGAGDTDGDGVEDVVVGAVADAGDAGKGRVRVLSGRDGRVLHTFTGDADGDQFGAAVAGAGDVDQDGRADVVVGAYAFPAKPSPYVRVFSGRDGSVLHDFRTTLGGIRFGRAVAGAGDVDADGHPDILVGAPRANAPGLAFIYSGRDGRLLWQLQAGQTVDAFGTAVSGAGDVDGDGRADVMVGAPAAEAHGRLTGSAYVFTAGRRLHTLTGDAAFDLFGGALAGGRDIDGDASPDFVVGASGGGLARAGIVRAFRGVTGQELFTATGDAAWDWFGWAVSLGADLNGDGAADLVVGAPMADGGGVDAGHGRVLSGAALALSGDRHELSLAGGGAQLLRLDAGSAHRNKVYLVLGSQSGTSPGLALGFVTLPLNPDPYFAITFGFPNSALLGGTLGVLDDRGCAQASFRIIPQLPPALAGTTLHHAFVVFGAAPFDVASNAALLRLLP